MNDEKREEKLLFASLMGTLDGGFSSKTSKWDDEIIEIYDSSSTSKIESDKNG